MDSKQYLYYGLGEIAYSIAIADGKLEREEAQKFHDLIVEEVKVEFDYNISEIIFALLKKENIGSATTFQWGIKNMTLGERYFTVEVRDKFVKILEKTAHFFERGIEIKTKLVQDFIAQTANFEGLRH